MSAVRESWRPQPDWRSTAAEPAIDVVAMTAPYTAMPVMVYADTFPWPTGRSPQSESAPNMR